MFMYHLSPTGHSLSRGVKVFPLSHSLSTTTSLLFEIYLFYRTTISASRRFEFLRLEAAYFCTVSLITISFELVFVDWLTEVVNFMIGLIEIALPVYGTSPGVQLSYQLSVPTLLLTAYLTGCQPGWSLGQDTFFFYSCITNCRRGSRFMTTKLQHK